MKSLKYINLKKIISFNTNTKNVTEFRTQLILILILIEIKWKLLNKSIKDQKYCFTYRNIYFDLLLGQHRLWH